VSRRKRNDPLNFREVILKCPHDHELCSLVQTRAGGLYQDNSRIELGGKIKALCPACREDGRYPDYQASWETVNSALKAAWDTRDERHILKLP
jgi:hypothetical protein